MIKYVALLRGIGPGNPNMANVHLREVCENLGFCNVQSVIASGNLLFESNETDTVKLESMLETAWPSQLGFTSTTLIRSQPDIQRLVDYDPFKELTHGPSSYLLATFLKHPTKPTFSIPYQPKDKPYKIVGYCDNALFTVTDNSVIKTTDLMAWLEKEFGKAMTSRSWNTVQRIYKKF